VGRSDAFGLGLDQRPRWCPSWAQGKGPGLQTGALFQPPCGDWFVITGEYIPRFGFTVNRRERTSRPKDAYDRGVHRQPRDYRSRQSCGFRAAVPSGYDHAVLRHLPLRELWMGGRFDGRPSAAAADYPPSPRTADPLAARSGRTPPLGGLGRGLQLAPFFLRLARLRRRGEHPLDHFVAPPGDLIVLVAHDYAFIALLQNG
jgi:hypothetical protein